jgi:hypothetical protein
MNTPSIEDLRAASEALRTDPRFQWPDECDQIERVADYLDDLAHAEEPTAGNKFIIGQCKYCKHWHRHATDSDINAYGENGGRCACEKIDYESVAAKDGGLNYQDSEGYSASLWTDQNFGCINWEAKQ